MLHRVILGFLGSTLDQGKIERWQRWRPSVAVCQHAGLPVDRFELIHGERHATLAQRIESDIGEIAPRTAVRRHVMDLADPWDFEEAYAAMHGFARTYPFDTEKEEYLVHITTGTHVVQICWFLLAEARVIPGRLLQLSPPRRWKSGEPGGYSIIDLDLSRYDRIATRFKAEAVEAKQFLKSNIATRNPAFNRMIDRIEQVAIRSKAPLLLTGPTGAGKSQLARRIFELKQARHQTRGPFVEVNCATLRGDGAMSALFGHVKGAFTGAQSERAGLLRAANGGVLFLDEIGELGIDEQAMILRAIEDKRFLPVGADKEASSQFQLIAGTNRDLARAVADGRFREDLLARLNLWTFALPGLKERLEDIEPNLDFELQRFAEQSGDAVTFNKEARTRYLRFATSDTALWPGNFRDLGGSLTRMATLAPSGRITEAVVDEEIQGLALTWKSSGSQNSGEASREAADLETLLGAERYARLDLFDAVQLAAVVRVCRRSRSLSAAGRALFSASRVAKASSNDADRLRKYLVRFDLTWDQITADRIGAD